MNMREAMVDALVENLTQSTFVQKVVVAWVGDGGVVGCLITDRHGRRHQARLLPVRGALGIAGLGRIEGVAEGVAEGGPLIVIADVVGPKLAAELHQRGLGYVDAAGNCHVELDDGRIVLHVEGRRRQAAPRPGGALRAAGYRALFALLARPELIGATVREIEAEAGASRHAVAGVLARLRDEGMVARAGRTGHVWMPGRHGELVDRFATGWADALRPAQLVGRFRTREAEPEAVEQAVARGLETEGVAFGFGGGAGAMRLVPYFRGEETVVHVEGWTSEVARGVGAAPDRDGPLVVLATMGRLDLAGPGDRTVHPLLMHAELARASNPRARDAARMVFQRFLQEPGE